jgi:hypothetical protein
MYVLQEEAFVFRAKKKKKKKKLLMCEEAQASWRLRLATTCMPYLVLSILFSGVFVS